MSDENIVRAKLKPDGSVWQVLPDGSLVPFESSTDWERLDAMTDDEIEAGALTDPDYFENHDSVTLRIPDIRVIREKLGLSQEDFAREFGLNRWQVKHWESGEEILSWESMLYLHVIDAHPEAVIDALSKFHLSRSRPLDEATRKKPAPMPGKRRKSA